MKNKLYTAAIISAALMALTGCATTTDLQQMERQTAAINASMREVKGNLDEINYALQAENKRSKETVDALAEVNKTQAAFIERLKSLEDEIGVVKRNQADLGSRLSAGGGSDVKALTGQVDEVRHGIEETNAKLDAMKAVLLQRIAELEEAARAMVGQPATEGGETGEAGEGQPAEEGTGNSRMTPQGDPNQMYQSSYLEYTKGNYDLAIMGFREYLKQFPDAEFAGSAQYYVGDSLYGMGRYDEALPEFDKVAGSYPSSSRVSMAMLKKGFTLDALKRGQEAKEAYEAVAKKYPGSEAARLAEEKLKKR